MYFYLIRQFTQTVGLRLGLLKLQGLICTPSLRMILVGKEYVIGSMFKLNVATNKTSPSIYMLCDFNIFHSRLCHVNKRVIFNLSSLGLISMLSLNDFQK